jgi:flagellar hook-associated protein 3 FlgL
MLVNNLKYNLNTNLTKMDKLLNQEATGRKYAHISDDPIAMIYGQTARNKLARLGHYQRTIDTAKNWLDQVEGSVMDLEERLADLYNSTIDASTDVKGTGDESDKRSVSELIRQLRDHYLDTLNSTFGDKYIFAGYNTPGVTNINGEAPKPFRMDDSGDIWYNDFNVSQVIRDNPTLDFTDPAAYGYDPNTPPTNGVEMIFKLRSDVLTFDVGTGVEMPVTFNGIDLILFQSSIDGDGNPVTPPINRNIFDVLNALYEDTYNGAPASEIGRVYIKQLQQAQNHLLTQVAEVGGRSRRLELLEIRYAQDEINYTQMMSDAEDVDFAEVIMNQKMSEAVYQAALSAGARVIQPTLMDFLR